MQKIARNRAKFSVVPSRRILLFCILVFHQCTPVMAQLKRLGIPTQDGVNLIDPLHILYLKANDNYTHFFLLDNTSLVSSKHLGYYEKLLDADFFFRVHHSYIVNLHFVTKYVKGDEAYVHLKGNIPIHIARTRKDAFLEKIGLKPKQD